MNTINFDALGSKLLGACENYLHSWLPNGRKESHEYVAINPRRADASLGSFKINTNTGAWADFSSGDKGGDLISLYAYINGIEQAAAAKQLMEMLGEPVPEYKAKVSKPKSAWSPILPVPEGIELIVPYHKLGVPNLVCQYRDIEGRLIGATCRFNIDENHKEVMPLTYCQNAENGKQEWRWQSFEKPRPMYGLEKLNIRPNANIILVEGEKTTDAAQLLYPKQNVMSWIGGSKSVKNIDFTPLAGRKVILCPDNDEPGFSAMNEIAEIISDIVEEIRFVMPPEDVPEGWDLADCDWSQEQALEYIKSHLVHELPKQAAPPPESQEQAEAMEGFPFRVLGYDRDFYYFQNSNTSIVRGFTSAQISQAQLLTLAPLQFWEREHPGRSGVSWASGANAVIQACEFKGYFSANKIRGRGTWNEHDGIVINLGDRVIKNGEEYRPNTIVSRFVYEAGAPMQANLHNPLTNKEAARFSEFCAAMPFEKPIHAKYLAGWCVLAHIGGALDWRPHIWTVGRKGSGKTYIMNKIVKRVLGENSLFVQSVSTEAGIRQTLGSDSIPVLFDESESDNEAGVARIQKILELVRQSSSEGGGRIIKGSPTGKSLAFNIRSCFAFSSINASIMQPADKSRITLLEVNQDCMRTPFEEIQKMEVEILTDEYIDRLYARSIALAPIIRTNSRVFARAAAIIFGEQRAGDQIGTLLAGAYSLHSTQIIGFDDAMAWVKSQDWREEKEEITGMNDEQMLFKYLMQQKLRVNTGKGIEEYPIGYLAEIALEKISSDLAPIKSEFAETILQRSGIKTEKLDGLDNIIISNESDHIARLLHGTSWSVGWSRVLRRMPLAVATGTQYFGFKGSESRAIRLPFD